MYFGIDVGGTKIQFAAESGDGVAILDKVPTPKTYAEFLNVVEEQFRLAAVGKGKIGCIGMGIPGTYTDETVIWSPNVPFLEGKDIPGDLRERLGVGVFLGNDAQLALAGEAWRGAARGRQQAILMAIGTGIGGAVMAGGRILRGRRGAAGAFGWLNLDISVPGDRNHGYLENHAAGRAIERMGSRLTPPLSPEGIVESAKKGNRECMDILKQVGRLLGAGLASIASVLDTEVIVLGGGISDELPLFSEALTESFREFSAPGVEEVLILKGQLGNLAGAYGALKLAAQKGNLWL
ncbi:ROK family protein [Neobacillus sp. SCS-31]|uniref:ROK family protein n=1 Tax=Neobacillus oceani TaxID=3115292 RepID=UPI00390696C4